MSQALHTVLLALSGDTLILPNSSVGEVMPADRVVKDEKAPAWLAGQVDWDQRRVPVLRFETLNGAPPPAEASRRERVVILHTLGVHWPSALVGIITQGYPHLVSVNQNALRPADLLDTDRADLILARTRIGAQLAAIPDLATLEADLARAL